MSWNGKYFVTLVKDGEVWRQDASRRIPSGCQVMATDNGCQDRAIIQKHLEEIRARVKSLSA
jgi:hypothetical protein